MLLKFRNNNFFLILFLSLIIILQSCKPQKLIIAETVKMREVCFNNALQEMINYTNSSSRENKSCYCKLSSFGSLNNLATYKLETIDLNTILELRHQGKQLWVCQLDSTFIFMENDMREKVLPLKARARFVTSMNSKKYSDWKNHLGFYDPPFVKWIFIENDNLGKFEVLNIIGNMDIDIYNWLLFVSDTICIDNPLKYEIGFDETPAGPIE